MMKSFKNVLPRGMDTMDILSNHLKRGWGTSRVYRDGYCSNINREKKRTRQNQGNTLINKNMITSEAKKKCIPGGGRTHDFRISVILIGTGPKKYKNDTLTTASQECAVQRLWSVPTFPAHYVGPVIWPKGGL